MIRAGGDAPYLAAPEIIDEDDFGGFQLMDNAGPVVVDLRWSDYLALKQAPPSLVTLKRDRIAVVSEASGQAVRQWSVYRSLVFEFDDDGARYVLSGGDWFSVDPDYATETLHYIQTFEVDAIALPAATADEHEDAYNARVRDGSPDDALLLDRILFRATQSQDSIEFCDLLLKPDRFVHVKRKSGSSTLSHLFNQGLVAGELLQFDEGFRDAVRARIDANTAFVDVIPAGPLSPPAFQIAFCVIAPAPAAGRHFLPFFSQVSFRRAAEQLSARGYRISLTRIDVAAPG